MNSAKKDRIVIIQTRVESTDPDYNGNEFTWADLHTGVYARKVEQRGKEVFAAQQVRPESTRQYVIDFYDDINESMRLVEEGVGWNITHIAELERGRELQLTVMRPGEEVDSDGNN